VTAIEAVPAESLKCQNEIARSGRKFAVKKLKTLAACLAKKEPRICPDENGKIRILRVAEKASAKISSACAAGPALSGLASSYASFPGGLEVASCALSQHNVVATILAWTANGAPAEISSDRGRRRCVKALSKAGTKYLKETLAAMQKCLLKELNANPPPSGKDFTAACVGGVSGGAVVLPADAKAAAAIGSAQTALLAAISDACGGLSEPAGIESIFACPGAETVADLQDCLLCSHWHAAADLVEQEFAESGTFVDPSGAGLQAAVDAAAVGEKLLVGSGTYEEQVVLSTDELELVGCGGATDERPLVVPPAGPGPFENGIFADGVNGLLFQSLEVDGFEENGIFVRGADGVTFRDTITKDDGEYGLFPVLSSNVLIEGCQASGAADTGIYVGQSTDIVLRYNIATLNVSGIEIENSAGAVVHNNLSINNTAGLLVFKLPELAVQLSNDHEVFNNVLVDNNTPSFAHPGDIVGLVPDGTGLLVLSNDDSIFERNVIKNNNSFGLAIVDQQILNVLVGSPVPFPVLSPDYSLENNEFRRNVLRDNAASPDNTPPNATPLAADLLFVTDGTDSGNCFENNIAGTFFTLDPPLPVCP